MMPQMLSVEYHDGAGLKKERLPWTQDFLECQNEDCGLVWEAVRPLGEDWGDCTCPECGQCGAELFDAPGGPPPHCGVEYRCYMG